MRAGLEDNFSLSNGEKAAGNGELIEQAARIVQSQGRSIATPNQAREMLGIPIPDRAR